MRETETKLRAFIEQETKQTLAKYSPDDDLFMALGMGSLEGLALLAKIEKRFQIKIPDEDLADMRTLNKILQLMPE